MIIRVWRGQTLLQHADDYVRHLRFTVFPRLGTIGGHRGASLLRRDVEGFAEFLVLTTWDSMSAIREFAGDNPELAVIEPAARAVLSDYDSTVTHYEVVLPR